MLFDPHRLNGIVPQDQHTGMLAEAALLVGLASPAFGASDGVGALLGGSGASAFTPMIAGQWSPDGFTGLAANPESAFELVQFLAADHAIGDIAAARHELHALVQASLGHHAHGAHDHFQAVAPGVLSISPEHDLLLG